jgi:diguanylate cyclase (GGDEF)-like protein
MRVTRLRTRLAALAVLPLAGLVLFASLTVNDRMHTARDAEAVAPSANLFRDLVELRFGVFDEHGATAGILEAKRLGLSADAVKELLQFDLGRELGHRRARVDAAYEAFRRDARSGADRAFAAKFASLRTRARAATTRADVRDRYGVLADLTAARLDTVLAQVEDTAMRTGRNGEIAQLGAVGEHLFDALDSVTRQAGDIVRLGGMNVAAPVEEESPEVTLVRRVETFDRSDAWLRRRLPRDLAAKWEAAQNTAAARRFRAAVAEAIAAVGEPPRTRGLDELGALYRDGSAWENGCRAVVADLAAVLVRESNDVRNDALGDVRTAVGVVVALVVLTLAAMALLARSISRPLRDLERHAHLVGDGALDEVTVHRRGPREVRVVGAAFDELVTNIRTIRMQAEALADGRIDDSTLATRVPGRVGRALEATVTRLARSLADGQQLRAALSHEASHDALSGLRNRAAVMVALDTLLERSRAHGEPFAVLFVDLDDFKTMNDRYGHDAGDHILRTIAQRLRALLRHGDIAGRLGGDEFIVIVPDLVAPAAAEELGDRLIAALSEPIPYEHDTVLNVRATVGVAISNARHQVASDLLREADAALYHGKESGRGRTIVFDDALRRELDERATFAARFRRAIAHDELRLHYQPVVTAADGNVLAVEALVRWQRDDELVAPGAFLPRVEGTPLVDDLGRWVLGEACRALVTWSSDAVLAPMHVSVNVSAHHVVSGSLIDDLDAALAATGADPARLVIEVTETGSIGDLAFAAEVLDAVRGRGVHVAIDDFDTAHATLAYLQRFPADVVKLHRSLFVTAGERDRQVAVLIVGVARTYGLQVVAEGIETAAEEATARSLGCDFLQGFRFARPVPASELAAAVRAARAVARADAA